MLKLLPKLAVLATIGVLALPGNEHQRNLVVQGIVQAYNKAYYYCETEQSKCSRLKELASEAQRVAFTPLNASHQTAADMGTIDPDQATWHFEQNSTVAPANWIARPQY